MACRDDDMAVPERRKVGTSRKLSRVKELGILRVGKVVDGVARAAAVRERHQPAVRTGDTGKARPLRLLELRNGRQGRQFHDLPALQDDEIPPRHT